MSIFLKKYFLIIFLIVALFLSLDLSFDKNSGGLKWTNITWALIILILLIIVFVRRMKNLYPKHPRGIWTGPEKPVVSGYIIISLITAFADIFPKYLLYDSNSGNKRAISKNFGFQSLFNPDPLSLKIVLTLAVFLWIFFVGALFFRFNIKLYDRAWIALSSMTFSASLVMTLERILFKGIHDIFYFEKKLRYLCPLCGVKYKTYAWCPADIFISWSILFLLFLYIASLVKRDIYH